MADIKTGIKMDSQFLNLREISVSDIKKSALQLLIPGEEVVAAFKTVRDEVVFTTKRILVINVEGVTGMKNAYFSYPYSKIQYYGIETAGLLEIDSELIVAFANGVILEFDFRARVDMKRISALISQGIL